MYFNIILYDKSLIILITNDPSGMKSYRSAGSTYPANLALPIFGSGIVEKIVETEILFANNYRIVKLILVKYPVNVMASNFPIINPVSCKAMYCSWKFIQHRSTVLLKFPKWTSKHPKTTNVKCTIIIINHISLFILHLVWIQLKSIVSNTIKSVSYHVTLRVLTKADTSFDQGLEVGNNRCR